MIISQIYNIKYYFRHSFKYQQEQYEKVMENMQERVDDVEAKLKAVRLLLQEKVNQLKEQVGP